MERLTKQEQESVVITMAIAIVLMLLLFFLKYTPKSEEKKEEIPVEVEIAQGLSGGGGGGGATINFGASGAGAKFQGSVSPPVEEVIGSNDDKAEAVANTSPVVNRGTRTENPKPQDNIPKKPTNAALDNMLGGSDASGGGNGNGISNGSYGAGGNGNGSGGGNGSGNGTGTGPGSGSGSGGGSGAGHGTGVGNYQLAGRNAVTKPKPNYNCNEEGTVVVTVSVDRSGKVISATAGARGTTNPASCLLTQAKAAALQTKFDSKDDAPEKQVGKIIYNFKLTD